METLNTEKEKGIMYLKHRNGSVMKKQMYECRSFMRENEITIQGVYYDNDLSAPEKSGLREVIKYCASNPVDVVVVYDEDSLGSTSDEIDSTYTSLIKLGTEPVFMHSKFLEH